jgi:transcriptional regulator with XRE-family HTH domain
MSLTALANKASISKAFLSMIERGQRDAAPPVAARLAQALGVAIEDLCP